MLYLYPHVISYRHWITPTSSGPSQVPDGYCDRMHAALPELLSLGPGPAPVLVSLLPLPLSVTSEVSRVLCLLPESVPCLSLGSKGSGQ